MPTEAKLVATRRGVADVADRSAADQLREREDLGHGQHWPLGRILVTSPADATRIVDEDVVLLHGRHEHRPQKAVCLSRHRDGHAVANQS
jgi:hypothetical protein